MPTRRSKPSGRVASARIGSQPSATPRTPTKEDKTARSHLFSAGLGRHGAIYQAVCELLAAGGNLADMNADSIFKVIEQQAREGVDFMTVHCGVTRAALALLAAEGRELGIVSRGGSLLPCWMDAGGGENPLLARAMDWEAQIAAALDPGRARELRQSSTPSDQDVCTMCGRFWAIKGELKGDG